VFDYNTHEQLFKDLRAMFDPAAHAAAQKIQDDLAAAKAAEPPAEPELLASSEPSKNEATAD
jgi:hypothetical protein